MDALSVPSPATADEPDGAVTKLPNLAIIAGIVISDMADDAYLFVSFNWPLTCNLATNVLPVL